MTEWGRNDDLRDRKKPRFSRDEQPLPDPKKKRRQMIAIVLLVVFAAGMIALQLRSCSNDDDAQRGVADATSAQRSDPSLPPARR